jgi:hypothetical protein
VKTIKNNGAQGDVLFIRVDKLPKDAKELPQSAQVIVGHSETGHHHAIANPDASVAIFAVQNQLRSYLKLEKPADVVHHRPHDTHETLRLPAGFWEIRRQREMSPEGWRRVED